MKQRTLPTLPRPASFDSWLKAFHLSIPALKLAGGLILFLYALSMVMGGKSKEDNNTHMAASTYIGATA